MLFLTPLVALGHIAGPVGLGHVIPKGLAALFSAQQGFGVDPLSGARITLDEASILAHVFYHIADNVGLVALGLGSFVLVVHGRDELAEPLIARVEIELFALTV